MKTMEIPPIYSRKEVEVYSLSDELYGVVFPEAGESGRFVCLIKDRPECAATGNSDKEAIENAIKLSK